MILNKEDISKILRDHYPGHTVDFKDVHLIEDEYLGNFIVIHVEGRKVIYQLEDGKVFIYKPQSLVESDDRKWKSIFRSVKLNILGV